MTMYMHLRAQKLLNSPKLNPCDKRLLYDVHDSRPTAAFAFFVVVIAMSIKGNCIQPPDGLDSIADGKAFDLRAHITAGFSPQLGICSLRQVAMGRKCSVANCRSNYTKDTKATVYGFPLKDEEQLDLWLAALPNVIRKSEVTRNMGVCDKHWPNATKMKTVRGKVVPATPPSVFPGCPSSFKRQTASSSSRNTDFRGVSSTARTREEDQLCDFDACDIIRGDFSDFVKSLSEKFSDCGLHVCYY